MEQPVDTALFAQIEPLVAAFGDSGKREWRHGASEIRTLVELPAAQEQLAAFEPQHRASPDAAADAVESAVEVAIGKLADPFRSAALAHFGYADERLKPRNKGEREEQAAKCFDRSDRWYRKPAGARFGERAPRDYVVALVTTALISSSEPEQQPEPQRRRSRRLAVAVVVVAVAVAVVLIATDGGHKRTGRALPVFGSVVDAADGKVVSTSLPDRPAPTEGQMEGGSIAGVCPVQPGACAHPGRGQPLVARVGELLVFSVRLHDPTDAPVPEIKLEAFAQHNPHNVEVRIDTEYPTRSKRNGLESSPADPVVVSFRDGKTHSLTVVPGSTTLYDGSEPDHMVGRLPDGIFGAGGITLTNVGAPRSCFDCDRNYIRYVFFEMRVA